MSDQSTRPTNQAQAISHVTDIQARYADELMQLPHVIGLAVGHAQFEGSTTNEISLIVLVDQKVPLSELAAEEVVPSELEGVRVDVQEIGTIQAF